MTGLPKGWTSKPLGELGVWSGGGTPSKAVPEYWADGSIPWVSPKDMKVRIISASQDKITEAAVRGSATQIIAERSVLIVTRSGILAHSVPVALTSVPLTVNQDIKAITPCTAVDPDFMLAALEASRDTILDKCRKAGTTVESLDTERLKALPIPLPPLPEQRRIVRKLDTLTARSTTARTHLTAIEKLVERYKRLVIGQLCLGGVASQFQDQAELPELPQGWEWSRAEDLCHWITKGTTPSKDELFAGKGDVPFIKVYNLTFSERLDFTVDPTFVSADTHNIALKRSKLFPGDVLMNIVGPPLGKTAIVPDDFPEWNMNQAIAVFRPKERLFNRFLLYWLSSEWFLSWALSRSKATAGQRNLTLEICRDTPVPLPSFNEQREIVHRIETAFAKIDRLAAEAAKALKLLGHLDQRILAKAFAGDLVPQDPTDEPAETLLARIRETRAAAPKSRRGRK